ncbi:ECF transporter S component [Corynebacterium poyangense]|uniref:ECF transporter S component n=1 Tax=Corynebacterium poyangense TaxID=2684405 RepID=A0A7H0SLH2_9CORY|nr:ECF transporter S component [Corynebacterium poyangense]MBZ8177495.1 ECF transporter S component [Corynebacterium poyangense]QNQ89397.1 ECF transporter S component [Corynebacterium poyangense]
MPQPTAVTRISLNRGQQILVGVGALLIAATWLFLVLTRPDTWEDGLSSTPALITLLGYVGGAIALLIATVPALPTRIIAIIPVALVLNIVIGEIVGSVGIPLYLDTIGTVFIAALAGPITGTATGVLTSVVWSFLNPAALPFAAGNALIGFLSGWAIKKGSFKNIVWVIITGVLLGAIAGVISAPVAAFVYGGTAGVGTGAVVSLFREMGQSLLSAVTLQSFLSDPLDKAIVMVLVWASLKYLPGRVRRNLGVQD